MQSLATIINVVAANVRKIRGFFEKWDEWLGKLKPGERSKVTGFMPKETNLAKLAKTARRAERQRRGPP